MHTGRNAVTAKPEFSPVAGSDAETSATGLGIRRIAFFRAAATSAVEAGGTDEVMDGSS
jgi:hypothetical protein